MMCLPHPVLAHERGVHRETKHFQFGLSQAQKSLLQTACEPGYYADSARAEWWDVHLVCVGMGHRDDDIALFVSCVDVAVSLGNVFQRIASIDDRLDLPRLNQLFEDQ
jgi:hypothetical protein